MSTITGYAELMNYRNLPIGGIAPQADSSVNAEKEQPSEAPRHQPNSSASKHVVLQQEMTAEHVQTQPSEGTAPDIRGILDSIRRTGSRMSEDDIQDALDDMVLRGDLTDDQADEIFAALKQARQPMPAALTRGLNVLAESGAMSLKQRDAAAAALSGTGERLQDLVDDGTLSQDQADAVMVTCRNAAKLKQARHAYSQMQKNPLARMAESRQYGILDAYEESMAEGAMA